MTQEESIKFLQETRERIASMSKEEFSNRLEESGIMDILYPEDVKE